MNSSNGAVLSSSGSSLFIKILAKLTIWNRSEIITSSTNLVLLSWMCSSVHSALTSWLQPSKVAFQILSKMNLHSPRQIFLPLWTYFYSGWTCSISISFQPALFACFCFVCFREGEGAFILGETAFACAVFLIVEKFWVLNALDKASNWENSSWAGSPATVSNSSMSSPATYASYALLHFCAQSLVFGQTLD